MKIGSKVKLTQNVVRTFGWATDRTFGTVTKVTTRPAWTVLWPDGSQTTCSESGLREVHSHLTQSEVVDLWMAQVYPHGYDLVQALIENKYRSDQIEGIINRLVSRGTIHPVEYAPTASQQAFYGLECKKKEAKPGALPTRENFMPGRIAAFFFKLGPWDA